MSALDRPVRVRDTYERRVEVITKDVVAAHNAQTEDLADHLVVIGSLSALSTQALLLTRERDEARVEVQRLRDHLRIIACLDPMETGDVDRGPAIAAEALGEGGAERQLGEDGPTGS